MGCFHCSSSVFTPCPAFVAPRSMALTWRLHLAHHLVSSSMFVCYDIEASRSRQRHLISSVSEVFADPRQSPSVLGTSFDALRVRNPRWKPAFPAAGYGSGRAERMR
ncbi:uncharacterized protein SCHCODRAFT_02320108 [Schizophyllum commune H4-8]|uniref:uncharacterized protein n=1 Tax=Schizophyllum commune (strain H4-8 / FGSC 9210) TaxID=578458 RepID=UPI00215E2CAF|nr:uncharacterized protein SCHCODRAFT_02320108 [Schizophyllum commune H4-8]KAI5891448.1 hypothetical protein SCHCODRAFT_02320108 [Schizophyllum commune H4-8]